MSNLVQMLCYRKWLELGVQTSSTVDTHMNYLLSTHANSSYELELIRSTNTTGLKRGQHFWIYMTVPEIRRDAGQLTGQRQESLKAKDLDVPCVRSNLTRHRA